MRGDGAIILDILNLVGRFFKFGMETKQFPSPNMASLVPSSEIQGDDQSACLSVSSSSARPNVGKYLPKFNSKSLGTP
jgi:hypothetical protein